MSHTPHLRPTISSLHRYSTSLEPLWMLSHFRILTSFITPVFPNTLQITWRFHILHSRHLYQTGISKLLIFFLSDAATPWNLDISFSRRILPFFFLFFYDGNRLRAEKETVKNRASLGVFLLSLQIFFTYKTRRCLIMHSLQAFKVLTGDLRINATQTLFPKITTFFPLRTCRLPGLNE